MLLTSSINYKTPKVRATQDWREHCLLSSRLQISKTNVDGRGFASLPWGNQWESGIFWTSMLWSRSKSWRCLRGDASQQARAPGWRKAPVRGCPHESSESSILASVVIAVQQGCTEQQPIWSITWSHARTGGTADTRFPSIKVKYILKSPCSLVH